jgi:large subunit ribosomal protein L3
MKILFKKMHMTQVWKNDVFTPITVLKFAGVSGGEKEKVNEESIFSQFKEGEKVNASGISKGKGFQGVVKRHGFSGGPKTHGQKNRLRAPGSIGPTAPQRVIKGRKMAGHMGAERVTIKNLTIVAVDKEKKVISLKGAVPGSRGTIIEISKIS